MNIKPAKTKMTQKEDMTNVNGRDLFMTPNYATKLVIPFIKNLVNKRFSIWECAAGQMKMANVFIDYGYNVVATDLSYTNAFNFLTNKPDFEFSCIITNPPFSLKKKFYERCVELGVPFALLIPADYSSWIISAIKNGCEKIIPNRRIDYITPNILDRVWEGENFEIWKRKNKWFDGTLKEAKLSKNWNKILNELESSNHNYNSIYNVPSRLLRKYSSSDFHSMWLTKGLGLNQSETFVELTNEMKNDI